MFTQTSNFKRNN